MKQRFLPIGFLLLLIAGLSSLAILTAGVQNDGKDNKQTKGDQITSDANDFLSRIRNNQHTGLLDPKDVVEARNQLDKRTSPGTKNSQVLSWESLGPDNIGGRTRALLFDNRDAENRTMYAGSVSGGIYKTTNLASTWSKVNTGGNSEILNVSCMVQADDGTIYVGTGEGFNVQNYGGMSMFGYNGGFMGKGLFKSDANDNFSLIAGTAPYVNEEVTEWAFVNELAIDKAGNRLFAATNTGLKYASMGSLDTWNSEFNHTIDSTVVFRSISVDSVAVCDSILFDENNNIVEVYGSSGWQVNFTANDTTDLDKRDFVVPFEEPGVCYDVKISPSGMIITTFDNRIYVSPTGDVNQFMNVSKSNSNPDSYRKDEITWSSTVTIKNKSGQVLFSDANTNAETIDWHNDYHYLADDSKLAGYPPSESPGRTEFAIAPSNDSVVYALVAKGSAPQRNSSLGIYLSEDKGVTWRTVTPGGSTLLNILGGENSNGAFYYQGDYSNTISVFPGNPYRFIAGGVNLWYGNKISETGFYQVAKKSFSAAYYLFNGIYDENYVHDSHHAYVFKPGTGSEFYIATDGGIFQGKVSGNTFKFKSVNKKYTTSQFYTLAVTNSNKEYVGGTQDNGTLYGDGVSGSGMEAIDIWRFANVEPKYPLGSNGGAVAFSNLRMIKPGIEVKDPPVFYSMGQYPHNDAFDLRMRRSETLGYDFSSQYLVSGTNGISNNLYLTPTLLWEKYNNAESKDSIQFGASENYEAGQKIRVRSNNYDVPFDYVLPEALAFGDTIMVPDMITTRLFLATTSKIWMTLQAVQFSVNPAWFDISDNTHNGFTGDPLGMDISHDGNYLFVGTLDGHLYRISNIAAAHDEATANVGNSTCIIATDEMNLGEDISQAITSVSVDPNDANKVLVTLGNYGNSSYVYYSTNALSDNPVFTSVQGNLPTMPVYCGLLELGESNMAIIGTEVGIYSTEDASSGNWEYDGGEIGRLPVMALTQQRYFKPAYYITFQDPVTNELFYEIYPETQNIGDIYAATFGRGVYKVDMDYVGIDDNPVEEGSSILNLRVYPNPSVNNLKISFVLEDGANSKINVYDLSGRLVVTRDFGKLTKGKHELPVAISSLNNGTYILQLVTGDTITTDKIVILK